VVSVRQLMTILAALGVDIALRPRAVGDSAVREPSPPTVTW
jgi:hypothetical protein